MAIADLAGGDWARRSRNALVALLTGEVAADSSVGVQLLADIHCVFRERRLEKLSTADLIVALCDLNPQWLEFSRGKPISPTALARQLKAFSIDHRKLRFDDATPWGYLQESFEDAWARYLPRNLEQLELGNDDAVGTGLPSLEHTPDVPTPKADKSVINMQLVPSVPVHAANKNERDSASSCRIHGSETEWWERPPAGTGVFVCARCHPQPHGLSAKEVGFSFH